MRRVIASFRYRRVFEAAQGKHHALNAVLETVTTPLVVTVDADTLLHPQSLTRLVVRVARTPKPARLRSQRRRRRQSAGDVRDPNAAVGLPTRINGVKRMQAAQHRTRRPGAFSAYWTSDAVGGWPDAVGEDRAHLDDAGTRGIVQYEPVALGLPVVPEQLSVLLSQQLTLGTRDVRRPVHASAAEAAPARKAGCRSLPRPLPRHRRHLSGLPESSSLSATR
jgi:biofilm PGA synthesis N-glycosyltransferase PgaC